MAIINLSDGKSIDISTHDITLWFGDIQLGGELSAKDVINFLRYLDSLEDEPYTYGVKV